MNHRLKQIEDRMEQYSKELTTNATALKDIDKKVEEISADIKKKDAKITNQIKQGEMNVYEEMRERETRRLNIVFFSIPELRERNTTGKDKLDWDRKSCCNIFRELELDMGDEAIKFCRRVGEAGGEDRPLVTGFWTEADRSKLLRNAKKLEKTIFSDISVAPDLTKVQREEEKELKKEAEKRNAQMTEQDRSKNLQWMVVGARGDKRLIKTVPREQTVQRGHATGRGRGNRGQRVSGMGTSRGMARGANRTPVGTRPSQAALQRETVEENNSEEEMSPTEEEEEMEEEAETEAVSTAKSQTDRRKRKGSGGRAVGAPPEKR
jgi:hypothetical protein